MIIKHHSCPGPGWRRLEVAFILCERSGQRIVLGPGEYLWTRAVI
jgi:hypothetical protein